MQRTVLFKKFLMPCGLCAAAVPVMKSATQSEEHSAPCNTDTQAKKLIKPSQLPIYSVEDGYTKQMPCIEPPSIVEENIRKIRLTIQGLQAPLHSVSDNISNVVDQFKFMVDYLQDKANFMPRIGAVGIGGLTGLVLSLRGGTFKRVLYTSTGAGIMGCICFPKEAKETFNTIEHYGNIGYNFIYGVKPGSNQKEFILSEIPLLKSVLESEYFRIISELFTQKTTEKLEENVPASKPEIEKK